MMAVTQNDIAVTLTNLRREATEAGLLAEGDTLIFERGSRTNGVSAALYVGERGSTCTFVPRFTLKQSLKDVLAIIDAATYALGAVNYKRKYGNPS